MAKQPMTDDEIRNLTKKTTLEKEKPYKQVPNQKTFMFPAITPSFIIDWFVNRWLVSLVIDKGTVPMLGKVSSGTIMVYYVYLYTKKVEL